MEVTLQELGTWCIQVTNDTSLQDVLKELCDLYIIQEKSPEHVLADSVKEYTMNKVFSQSLKNALKGYCKNPWEKEKKKKKKKEKEVETEEGDKIAGKSSVDVNAEIIEKYMSSKWNRVREFLVDPSDGEEVNSKLVKIMEQASLLKRMDETGQLVVSTSGYEFVLKDSCQQVWEVMAQYLRSAVERNMNLKDLIECLFMLSMCTLGEGYSPRTLTESQQLLIYEWAEFGIIYYVPEKSTRFFPTSLAINAIHGASYHNNSSAIDTGSFELEDDESTLTLLIETNFRVYAYTSSNLHLKMLELFVELEVCITYSSRCLYFNSINYS
jgi:transcription initiation factor TFIIH subunit 4